MKMYTVIGYLETLLSGVIPCVTLTYCLTPKYPRKYCLSGFIACIAMLVLFKTICGEKLLIFASVLLQAALAVYVFAFFKDSLSKKTAILLINTTIVGLSTEYISILITQKLLGHNFSMNRNTEEFVVLCGMCCVFGVIEQSIFYLIWQKIVKHENRFRATLLVGMVTLIFIVVGFSAVMLFTPNGGNYSNLLLTVSSLTIAVVGFVLLVFIANQQKKNDAEDAYYELQKVYELEQAEYMELEARSEELSMVRHDINNQLATIDALLQAGDKEKAKQFAEEVEKHISKM